MHATFRSFSNLGNPFGCSLEYHWKSYISMSQISAALGTKGLINTENSLAAALDQVRTRLKLCSPCVSLDCMVGSCNLPPSYCNIAAIIISILIYPTKQGFWALQNAGLCWLGRAQEETVGGKSQCLSDRKGQLWPLWVSMI